MKNDKTPPSDAAMRAAEAICKKIHWYLDPERRDLFAQIIDKEFKELIEAGELILVRGAALGERDECYERIPIIDPTARKALEMALRHAKGTTPGNGDLKEAMDAEFMHVMGVDE